MANNAAFVQAYRLAVTNLLHQCDTLRNLNAQYVALDLGNVLEDGVEGDFDGNADVTLTQFVSGISSVDALFTLLGQGHSTNLYRLIKQ